MLAYMLRVIAVTVFAGALLVVLYPAPGRSADAVVGDSSPSLAYDGVNDQFFLVYGHVFTTVDIGSGSTVFHYEIRGQKLSPSGAPLGASFQVDQATADTFARSAPDVAMPGGGDFLVTWSDSRSGVARIYGRFIPAGTGLLGGEFTVSDGSTDQRRPAAAFGWDTQTFLVVWEQAPAADAQVYSHAVPVTGGVTGADQVVHAALGAEGGAPDVVYDDNSEQFVTVFTNDGVDKDIYVNLANGNGAPGGVSFPVSTAAEDQHSPAIAFNPIDGQALIAFADNRAGSQTDDVIYVQRFASNATTPSVLGAPSVVPAAPEGPCANPALAWDGVREEFLLAFEQVGHGGVTQLRVARIGRDGVPQASSAITGLDCNRSGPAAASGFGRWLIAGSERCSGGDAAVKTTRHPPVVLPLNMLME